MLGLECLRDDEHTNRMSDTDLRVAPDEQAAGPRPDFMVGAVTVRPDHSVLSSEKGDRRIEPRIMDVLCLLAAHPGEVVSRETLIEDVWQVEYGADESLTRAVSLLRKTFVELDPDTLYIRTVPRRGYSLAAPVGRPDGESPPKPAPYVTHNRQLSFAQYVLGLVVAVVLTGILTVIALRPSPSTEPARLPSIAVLPFQNLSEAPSVDYFAQGIAEEVLHILSRFETLKVGGDSPAFSMEDGMATREELGQMLGVGHLLEGTIRSNGEEVRISVQLIQTADNRQIWSNSYLVRPEASGSSALQENIAGQIAGAISIALGIQSQNRLPGTDTDSLDAYEHYLQGREHQAWLRPDRNAAMQSFQRAVELDPDYASAVTELAAMTGDLAWEAATPEEARTLQQEARALAKRALDLNPDLAQTHATYAVSQAADGEWEAAANSFEEALSIARNARILMNYALMLTRTGKLHEARNMAEAALELEPDNPGRASTYAIIMTELGLYEDARQTLDRARDENGELPISASLEWILAMQSDVSSEEVRTLMQDYIRKAPETAPLLERVLSVHGEPDAALVILEEAATNRQTAFPAQLEVMATLAAWYGDDRLALEIWERELSATTLRMLRLWAPRFAGMRELDGFRDLARSLALPEYWRATGWPDACQPEGDSFSCQ